MNKIQFNASKYTKVVKSIIWLWHILNKRVWRLLISEILLSFLFVIDTLLDLPSQKVEVFCVKNVQKHEWQLVSNGPLIDSGWIPCTYLSHDVDCSVFTQSGGVNLGSMTQGFMKSFPIALKSQMQLTPCCTLALRLTTRKYKSRWSATSHKPVKHTIAISQYWSCLVFHLSIVSPCNWTWRHSDSLCYVFLWSQKLKTLWILWIKHYNSYQKAG